MSYFYEYHPREKVRTIEGDYVLAILRHRHVVLLFLLFSYDDRQATLVRCIRSTIIKKRNSVVVEAVR